MGTDAHPLIEVRGRNHRWGLKDDKDRYWRMFKREKLSYEEVDARKPFAINYLGSRNYRMFGGLADVRNYRDGVTPLFPRRGTPVDASAPVRRYMNKEKGDLHSHTYFTLQELLDADLDAACSKMEFGLMPTQYANWRDTGVLDKDAEEAWLVEQATEDPIHRAVSEEEMLLLLASGDPKTLTKKCDKYLPLRKGAKTLGGPFVKLYIPISYRRLLPELDQLIESLKEYGPPDRVRVIIAFDN